MSDEMDKWLITAMSHMKTMYEDEGIPWDEENEAMFQKIRQFIIKQKPEIDDIGKYMKEKAIEIFELRHNKDFCIEQIGDIIAQIISEARATQQEYEIDEKYVEGKARRIFYAPWELLDINQLKAIIRQIINDAQGTTKK